MTDEQKIVIITSPHGVTAAELQEVRKETRAHLPHGAFVCVLPPGFVPVDTEAARVVRKAAGDEIRAILREHRLNPASAVYEIGELAERLGSVP